MKSYRAFLLILAFFLNVPCFAGWDGTVDSSFAGGDGTPENPYLIATAGQLARMAKIINYGSKYSGSYELVSDIVLNDSVLTPDGDLVADYEDLQYWTPIGFDEYTSLRSGETFNGNGHTISGIYIPYYANSSTYKGLFGYCDGRVQNVKVKDSYIGGGRYIGGICGYAYNDTISEVSFSGKVIGSSSEIGGICGESDGAVIRNVAFSGSVSGKSSAVGGICGWNEGRITQALNSGSVSGNHDIVGGICGKNAGIVEDVLNVGPVRGVGQNTGGICGLNFAGFLARAVSAGPVFGGYEPGGLCGYTSNYGRVRKGYGDVQASVAPVERGEVYSDSQFVYGFFVSGMTGDALRDSLGNSSWVYGEGLYPRPKNGFENSDMAIVAATPLFLVPSASIGTEYETLDSTASDFTVGITNGVVWSRSGTGATLDLKNIATGKVSLVANGPDTLAASLNGVVYKRIPIEVNSPLFVGIVPQSVWSSFFVRVIPSPQSGAFTVELDNPSQVSFVRFYSLTGRLVYEIRNVRSSNFVRLPSGRYMGVMIRTGNSVPFSVTVR